MSLGSIYSRAQESAKLLQKLTSSSYYARVAIICGSGLGGLQDVLLRSEKYQKLEISYDDIPNFPRSTVAGHEGKLVFGAMKSTAKTAVEIPVMLFVGRAHFYEGHEMSAVTFATRVCKLMGVETVIVTNAAGGLNPGYNVGDVVMLSDHLNLPGLVGNSPLRGPNEEEFGVRFPPLSDAYDLDLRRRAHRSWSRVTKAKPVDNRLHEGVYVFLGGPNYETRAECRMLRSFGADLVGMSTVPEVVVARHCGMKVLALSLVTNKVVEMAGLAGNDPSIQDLSEAELAHQLSLGKANHEEVLQAGREAAAIMMAFISDVVANLAVPFRSITNE